MKHISLPLFILIVLSGCMVSMNDRVQEYNIVWDSPSADHNGSMPIGNGETGLNVWVETDGDLCFYIGRTDSWGDNGRLLKVGKVRVRCEPALYKEGYWFNQELDLATGTIRITASDPAVQGLDVCLNVWVDANHPVIHVEQESAEEMTMTAMIELWRTERTALPELNTSDLLEDRSKPGSLHEPVYVEADSIIASMANRIGWYHHNAKSVGFDLTNQLQALDEFMKTDPILHRTFGAVITGTGAEKINDLSLSTAKAKTNTLSVWVMTTHPSSPGQWLRSVEDEIATTEVIPFDMRRDAHEEWWQAFWDRSWIKAVRNDSTLKKEADDAFIVSRAYALQRFIDASAGRGAYPVKFNGSIFTVPYPDTPGDADYRRWGPGYWWQNTRLPYLSMCAAGDYDLMQPFFEMYAGEIFRISEARTKKYFGFDGAYFPECMYFWGSVFTATYGWTPYEQREDKLQESGWHKWEWVAGPELVFMMMDYYDYTLDTEFLQARIIPVANSVLKFFDNYYKTGDDGKLVMHPAMACETWWDCTNPMPEIAGLKAVTRRLLNLPEEGVDADDRNFWIAFDEKLPPLPLRDTPDGPALAPAEHYAVKNNIENPELYAVFPFRHIALGNDHPEWGIHALNHRWDRGDFGWRQDDLFMTYLGLADQARENLVSRAKNFHKDSRFPAFWGPNYDWIPDQDHGGVLMRTLQSMLVQADPYSEKIYLLPAWPEQWNGEFRLHAPYKTVIEGKVEKGKITRLKVTPESRQKDIIYAGETIGMN